MALLFKRKLNPGTEMAVWRIEESESFFYSDLALVPSELDELEHIKGRRRLEWLASRYLVHMMLVDLGHSDIESRISMNKDQFGKPHLKDSKLHVSFSHSHEMAAALLSDHSCGIDIQFFVPKIERIAHRFIREIEAAALRSENRISHMHLYWGAKESMYKAYGRKELDFKNQIMVTPFLYAEPSGGFSGEVWHNDFHRTYELRYEKLGEYFLVWGLEVSDLNAHLT